MAFCRCPAGDRPDFMLRMLQNKTKHFQRLPSGGGNSMRHARDMK
jgi:hypothetical protein